MRNLPKSQFLVLAALCAVLLTAVPTYAEEEVLPPEDSADFCSAVQKILARTGQESENKLFDEAKAFRKSKPSVRPLRSYQVVTYDAGGPLVVSCKVKTADHIRAQYGERAAGKQRHCPEVTRRLKAKVVSELAKENPEAAERAREFIVDDDEPYITGYSYLSDFAPSYEGEDGKVHFRTPGLQTNWDNWLFWPLPDQIRGQAYCHIPTSHYMKALATGAAKPGALVSFGDDANTVPIN
jgi:hypothetical protein